MTMTRRARDQLVRAWDLLAWVGGEVFTFRGGFAVSLHDCYSLPAKLDTVFTRPTLCYADFYAPDATIS
jgi:hypothetical protein